MLAPVSAAFVLIGRKTTAFGADRINQQKSSRVVQKRRCREKIVKKSKHDHPIHADQRRIEIGAEAKRLNDWKDLNNYGSQRCVMCQR
jgi:hypothetical protein